MTEPSDIIIRRSSFKDRRDAIWQNVKLGCGPTFVEHVVPPAGEDYAFDIQHYRREVEVYVSPTGRSVRVWIDGNEVPA